MMPVPPDETSRDNLGGDAIDEVGNAPSTPTASQVIARLDDLWRDERIVTETLSDPIGRSVGRYQIVRVLGRGSFGVVYQANDEQLVRTVALKLPRPEVLVDSDKLNRFEGEAIAAAALDHPLIVPLLEADLDGPTPYIASAYCPGPDLGVWLAQREEPVAPNEAASFIAQLAAAVQYAHEQGVYHRDLKPSNVLLEPVLDSSGSDRLTDYKPRLTDFGLAKLAEASLQDTRSSLLIGSPLYMAPEQLTPGTENAAAATDVYSLGVLLFELLTLRTPVVGDSYIEVIDNLRNDPPQSLHSLRKDLPRDLDTICNACLANDPRERYSTAEALQEDLGRFQAGEPLEAKPWGWRDHLWRWTNRPERITQAGWFAVLYQTLAFAWMILVLSIDLALGYPETGLTWKMVGDASLITLTANLPIALLGWRTLRGDRWPFWPTLALTTVMFVFVTFTSIVETSVFAEFYPTLHSKVSAHVGLLLGASIEAVLFWLAIPAWLRKRR